MRYACDGVSEKQYSVMVWCECVIYMCSVVLYCVDFNQILILIIIAIVMQAQCATCGLISSRP